MIEANYLVITDVSPGADVTAGQALLKFVEMIDGEVHCFTICDVAHRSRNISRLVQPLNSYWAIRPNENWNSVFRFFAVFGELLARWEAKLLFFKINGVLESKGITHILIVLQGQTMYRFANLINQSRYVVKTITWDSWDWWGWENSVPKITHYEVRKFQSRMSKKGFHLLPSAAMANSLMLDQDNFQVFRLPTLEIEDIVKANLSAQKTVIKIAFSGKSYAMIRILEFISLLDQIDWKVFDFSIELHVFGVNDIPFRTNIYHHGHFNQADLLVRLSEMDVAFLPYPMEEIPVSVGLESFPSKLSDYCFIGLPVIYSGPMKNEVSKVITDIGVSIPHGSSSILFLQLIQELVVRLDNYSIKSRLYYDLNLSQRVFRREFMKYFSSAHTDALLDYKHTSENILEGASLQSTTDMSLSFYPSHLLRFACRLMAWLTSKRFFSFLRNKIIKTLRSIFKVIAHFRVSLLSQK
jgi:hypothetical protein